MERPARATDLFVGAPDAAPDRNVVSDARAMVVRRAAELGVDDLADDAALVVSELVTNALLHGGGCTGVEVRPIEGGLRIEVYDGSPLPPMLGRPSEESLTGRGLRLVASVSSRWGADAAATEGKVVWAEITEEYRPAPAGDDEELLAMWGEEWDLSGDGVRRFHIQLGDVPTDLLLAAKSHVDNVVREFTLAAAGAEAGHTAEVPPRLRALLGAVVDRFAEARLAIKRQAIAAAERGDERTMLALDLPPTAADAAEEYLRALDEVDSYSRAQRLLTIESPPQHRVFRHWYIEEVVRQLRALSVGRPAPRPQTFERRLLDELDRVAVARREAERAARLYSVTAALAAAATPEAVAEAVLNEGVAALRAMAGGVLLATDADRLVLHGAVGYDETVLARLGDESRHAELPAAVAFRTGQAVWLESRAESDEQFPELAGMEAAAVAQCAVPLEVQGRRLGVLRFSFSEARLFSEDERRFVLALAGQTAQALDRAQLQRARLDVSRRLQRSLLPPNVPETPGMQIAAIYHPFGDGMEVGGDFYDIWPVGPGQWALAIGDAAGTGPEAAALTARVRYTLRALTMSEREPAEIVHTLNTALLASADEEDERFCTALFGMVTAGDPIDVELASGGHPLPVVRRAGGAIGVVGLSGSLLGVLANAPVDSAHVQLHPGDTLVLVTDGVLEARQDGRFFGLAGLEAVLAGPIASAGAAAAAVEQAVLDHTGGVLTDDMAAVVLHVPATA